jgi:hypothetical protein
MAETPLPPEDLNLLDGDNWAVNLAAILRHAQPGDTIAVPNASVQALAERALVEQGQSLEGPEAVLVVVR